MPRIFIVTGEASGDLHGARLAEELYKLRPDVSLVGVGGHKMIQAGVSMVHGIQRVDAIGVPGLRQIWKGARTLWQLKRFLQQEVFDAVVLIDSPGMNLRLARSAARAKQRIVYYIAPQIWAWGSRRIKLIKRAVNRMIVILPFEEGLYRQAGIPCDFVGHPLRDIVAPSYNKKILRHSLGLPDHSIILGILPGSREQEVQNLLPTMMLASQRIAKTYPHIHCVIAQSSSIPTALIKGLIEGVGVNVTIVHNQPSEVMAASDLLFVASGTATLQAAIIGTPMVIVYRLSWLTYQLAKRLVKVDCIGLVNIVAGRIIARELIQHDMTPERLSQEALRLLENPKLLEEMKGAFRQVREALGNPGASRRAAELVLIEAQA